MRTSSPSWGSSAVALNSETLTVPVSDDGPPPPSPGASSPQAPAIQQPSAPRVPRPTTTPDAPQRGAATVAAPRDPQRWAKVLELSKKLHLPSADFVDRNYDQLSRAAERQDTMAAQSQVSPSLQSWLADPDNATLAKHEIAPLGQVDRGARTVAGHPAPSGDQPGVLDAMGTATATGYADLASSTVQFAVAHGLVDAHRGAQFVADMNLRAKDLRDQAPDYVKQYQDAVRAAGGDWDVATPDFVATKALEQSADARLALTGYASGAVRTAGELLDRLGVAAQHAKGWGVSQLQSLASMLPFLGGASIGGGAGAAIGSALPLVGTALGGAIGTGVGVTAAMAPTSIGSEITQQLAARGVDVTNADALEAAYRDPATMQFIRGRADRGGLTAAAVAGLFAPFAGKLLGAPGESAAKDVLALSGRGLSENEAQAAASLARTSAQRATSIPERVARGAGDVTVQAGGMAASSASGDVAREGKLSAIDPHTALQTFLDMLGVGFASEAAGASRRQLFDPDIAKAGLQVGAQATDAARSVRDAQVLAEVGRAVKDAPTTASVPDRIKSLIETATGGQDAATVYFQPGDWDAHWESTGASPAKAAADVMGDDGRAYYEAKATGAPLAIPLGDYVAKVAPTEHWDGLLGSARTRPDGMSLGEAHEYLQSLPATLHELADEATKPAGAPMDASAVQVRTDVEDQLLKSGVTPNAARAQAQLYEAAFRTLGDRAGIGARALFNRYGLTIGRGPLELTPEARAKLETAKAAGEAAIVEEETIAEARGVLAGQGTDTGTARAKLLDTVTPAFSDEAEAARLTEEEGAPRAAPLDRPRTASGRLRNLEKATPEQLANEYMVLNDANAQENVAPTAIDTGSGATWTGMKPAAMKAIGRIAARAKTIAKLEAEMQRRGMDPAEAYMSGYRNLKNQDPTGFDFSQAAVPTGTVHLDQSGSAQPRGRITFGDGRDFRIELLQGADRSTFLHETGHFYLEVLGDLARGPNAPDDLKTDYAAVREWLGAAGDTPLTTAQHEQFARGFEAYLMEGKAPSSELRLAFARFKNWLVGIYQNLTALKVDLTPQVRGVFDRLLATREEIRTAAAEQNVGALFDDPHAIGMTDEEAAAYGRAVTDARESAEEELTTRLMRSIRKEESAQWKTWREPIEGEVTTAIDASPLYQALEAMRTGTKPDGSPLDPGTAAVKLNADAVKDALGAAAGPVMRLKITAPDGVDPDVAAELYGFDTGRDLLNALKDALPRDKAIRAETDARMHAVHGVQLSDVDVRELATSTLHSEKRVQLLRKELQYLASDHLAQFKGLVRAVQKKIPPTAEIEAQALKIVGAKSVRLLRPDLLEKAATRASIEAREALLKGDIDAAFEAKRKELLATEVYRAAQDAKDVVDGALDTFKKIFQRDDRISETRDMDLVSAARSILAQIGIGSSTKSPEDYLSQIREYDPEAADYVQSVVEEGGALTRGKADYRDLTVDDFTTLNAYVSALWNLAKSSLQVTIDGEKMDRREIQNALAARAEVLRGSGELPGYRQRRTAWEAVKAGLLSYKAVSTKIEHWVRAMDDGDPLGIYRKYLWNRVSEAATAFRVDQEASRTDYAEFLTALRDREGAGFPITRDKIPASELGYTFAGHNELLGALLHQGNRSNLTKNLVGRHWGRVLEDGTLDTTAWDAFTERMRKDGVLTKAHYDYVQGVWDRFERQKPAAQQAFRAMFGRYFPEITKDGFSVTFADGSVGNYAGGYYPAKADRTIVSDAQARADRDSLTGTSTSYMFPSVWKGFTVQRMERYMKPLMMDASAVPNHLDSVLQFTHLAPAVREIGRVVMNPGLRDSLHALDPAITSDALVPWLQRAAAQRGEQVAEGGDFWRYANKVAAKVRASAAMQIMTANSTVVLEQLTHFPSVLVRVGARDLSAAAWRYTTSHAAMAEEIGELSPFMRTRISAGLDIARQQADRILLDPTVFENARDFTNAHSSFLMTGIQSVMDHVVWSAAYDRAMETMEPSEAVRHADATVRELLGSYGAEDVSRIEAGTPIQKLFTMFTGFFLTKANVLHTEIAISKQLGLPQNKGRLASAAFFGFLVPAMIGAGIRNAMAGKGALDQQDDEGTLHALLSFFGQSAFDMGARMVPFAGPAIASFENYVVHGRSLELLTSPATKMAADALAGAVVPFKLKNQQITQKQLTDFFTFLGMATNLPARPLARPIGARIAQ